MATAWVHLVDFGRQLCGGNDDILVVFGGFFLMMLTYWTVGFFYLFFDMSVPNVVNPRFKIQPARLFKVEGGTFNPSLRATISNALFNQCFVFLPSLFLFQTTAKLWGGGIRVSDQLPTVKETLFVAVVLLLVNEFSFYWSHRLLHHPSLYKYHKAHHSYKTPIALSAIYSHPLEAFVSSSLAIHGPAFCLNIHVFHFWIGIIIGWMLTLRGHSGYDLPLFSNRHDMHHSINTGNYGTFGLCDWLFNTEIKQAVKQK